MKPFFAIQNSRKQAENHKLGLKSEGNPLADLSEHIQKVLLKKIHPTLCDHLNAVNMQPQVYGTRWIRVLFSREFSLTNTIRIWDMLFCCSTRKDFPLIPYFALAMIIGIQNRLLNHEYVDCLKILLDYPQLESVERIIAKALEFEGSYSVKGKQSSSVSIPSAIKLDDSKEFDSDQNGMLDQTPFSDVLTKLNLFKQNDNAEVAKLTQQVEGIRTTCKTVALHIEEIVEVLKVELSKDNVAVNEVILKKAYRIANLEGCFEWFHEI